jgi:Na+/H+ antiporter NhaD/arsenite permease-like protein
VAFFGLSPGIAPGSVAAVLAALIFIGTYAVIAIGRLPGSRLDRTGAALLGASLMVASGALSLDEAYRAIDLDTIALLLGMMIVVANLRFAGFFQLVNAWIARYGREPLALLARVIVAAGGLSAFLVNDTVCLVLTPLIAELCRAMRRNPVPYLLALAMSSNIGSTATITGNPQNMIIGSLSHLPYGDFAAALAPVAAAGLLVVFALIAVAWRRSSRARHPWPPCRASVGIPRFSGSRWPCSQASCCSSFGVSRPPRSPSSAARCCW